MKQFEITDYTIEDITFHPEAREAASELVRDSMGTGAAHHEYDAFLSSDCHRVIAALASGACVVGVLGYRIPRNNHSLSVERLAVAKKYRGNGVGETLLTKVELIASTLGRSSLELCATNTSLGYYHRLGFERLPASASEYDLFRTITIN